MTRLLRRLPGAFLAPLLAAVAPACAPEIDPPDDVGAAPAETPALPDTGRVHERAIVFVGTGTDSVFVVPWLLGVRTGGDRTLRHTRGWLLRGGVWDPFHDVTWDTPPVRAPWRPLPHGPLRIVVGPGGALEILAFVEGTRRLDLRLGSSRAEWTGRRGETFRLLDGGLVLAERRVPGLVFDLSRSRDVEDGEAGDWLVLASGDSLQAVVHTSLRAEAMRPDAWSGWVHQGANDLPLGNLTVTWSAVRAFDRARRDVPVGWTIASGDGTVEAELEARSSHLVAGAGDGPLLPVDGLVEVAGTLTLEGIEFPVHGLLRHTQGD